MRLLGMNIRNLEYRIQMFRNLMFIPSSIMYSYKMLIPIMCIYYFRYIG